MKRLVNRVLVAAGLAGVLAFAVGVPVVAQYGPMAYEGQFHWLSDNRQNHGFRWFPAPRRGWTISGPEWSAATSFPARVWEFEVGGAPPNDPCFPVPFPLGGGYFDRGPFGLQVNQYLAEWWDGTTYRSNPSPPAGWTAAKFGWFDFANNRSDRLMVDTDGAPGGFVGDIDTGETGACIGRVLARQRGEGIPWEAELKDETSGEPCMATPYTYRARMNLEIRCEPDLSVRDDYTVRFYDVFDRSPFTALPDGVAVPVLFPVDYPAGTADALARIWVRRIDAGLDSWLFDGDGPYSRGVPASQVFEGAGGSSWGAVAANRPEYLQHHAWRLDPAISAAQRRASPRNLLKTYGPDGTVTADHIIIRDLIKGVDDCVSLNAASYETPGDIDWPCGRMNAPGLATNTLQSSTERTLDLGPASPSEVAAVLAEGTFPGAVGNRRPEPPGSNFWFEMDTFAKRCHTGAYQQRDLRQAAAVAIAAWNERFNIEWAEYLELRRRALFNPDLWSERDDAYRRVSRTQGMLEGWRVILAYRQMVHPEMHEAFRGAGYESRGAGATWMPFAGASSTCDAISVTLQPLRPIGGGHDVGPVSAASLTADAHLQSFTEVPRSARFRDDQFDDGVQPHYLRGSSVSVAVGAASHYVRDMVPGTVFPDGPTHWNGADVTDSPALFISIPCGGGPRRDLFAPDVIDMPSRGFWNVSGEWEQILDPDDRRRLGRAVGGGRAFEPDALASYTECVDPAFGAGDCYASAEMERRMAEYQPGGVETLTSRAYAAHRDLVRSGVDSGMYRADSFRDYDRNDPVAATRTFDQYKRELSGDLDASGNPIRLDNSGLSVWGARIGDGRPSDYEVTPVAQQYGLEYLFASLRGVYTGFADLDYLYNSVPHQFTFVTDYWGVTPGTNSRGVAPITESDRETFTRTGPVRLSGAMGYARGAGLGSCTVCSENGCDASVVEDFPGERFTSSVTQGSLVCLIGPTPIRRPAHSCPTVANTR